MAAIYNHCDGYPSLSVMPREIIYAIISHLKSGRDVATCCVALGEDASYTMIKRNRASPLAWIRAGAPLDIVCALLERAKPSACVPFEWVEAAARGGRRDVLVRLHTLSNVDVAQGISLYQWVYVQRERKRSIFEQMRALLKAAVTGRGGSGVINYILDVYDAPRFRLRRLFNSGMLVRLSRYAIHHRSDATDVLEALHSHDKRGKCGCTKKLAYDAARADRPDILAWMNERGCRAIADAVQTTRLSVVEYVTRRERRGTVTTVRRHAYPWSEEYDDIALAAVRARAASAIAWFGPKANRRRVVDAICRLDDLTCADRVDLIVRGSLTKAALTMLLTTLVALLKRPHLAWMTTPWRLILLGAMVACSASRCTHRPDPLF